jgi:hypothetical protein
MQWWKVVWVVVVETVHNMRYFILGNIIGHMGSAHRTVLFDKRQNVLEGFFSP